MSFENIISKLSSLGRKVLVGSVLATSLVLGYGCGENTPSKTAPDVVENQDKEEKTNLQGQLYFNSHSHVLLDGKGGVNLAGNVEELESGFYNVEGFYDPETNTLNIEGFSELSINCNQSVEVGNNTLADLVCVNVEGLIASAPKEMVDELNAYIAIPNTPTEYLKVFPYLVYDENGIYAVLSNHFEILPTEFTIEYGGKVHHLYFSAGRVEGTLVKTELDEIGDRFRERLGEKGFDPLEFKGIIIANSITPSEPVGATVEEINANPEGYAFKRVSIDASYVVTTVRIDYGEDEAIKVPFGLGSLADTFSDFYEQDPQLRLEAIDPERKVWQFREAEVIGTVLYPTEEVLRYFDYAPPSTRQEIRERVKPVLLVDSLVDEVVEVSSVAELNRFTGNPSQYLGKVVKFDGIALGANVPVVKYLETAIEEDIPVEVNTMAVGIADPLEELLPPGVPGLPVMAIIGLNNDLIEGTEIIAGSYNFRVAVSEMPQEFFEDVRLRGSDTAFFLLEKEKKE